MTIAEKAAYLKGLVEGQQLDAEAGDGKLWHVVSELLGDIAAELKTLHDGQDALSDRADELDEEVDFLNLVMEGYDEDYDDDDDELDDDDGYYPFGDYRDQDDDPDGEEEEDEDEDDEEDFGVNYEVKCPNCGELIEFSEDVLDQGSVRCPSCGASLTFDSLEEDSEEPDEDQK